MLTSTLLRAARRAGYWLAAVCWLLASPAALAQLSGAYTINNAQPTGGTNYASFGAATAALTGSGVSGAVTFAVSGGPYTEQVVLGVIPGTSATNTVTFNGGGRTLQSGATTATQLAVFMLNGCDYVTIDNLVVDATAGGTSTAAAGWGIQLANNADNCTINNCTVVANTTSSNNTYAGIVSSASTTAAFTTGAAASQNLTITGNTVTGGYYGIVATGNTNAAPTPGLTISNNNIRDFYFYGVYSIFMTGPAYNGNDISRPTRASVTAFYGLNLVSGIYGATINGNRLHNPFTGAPTSTFDAYGIALSSLATANTFNIISNNLVYNMDGNGTTYALHNGSSSSAQYYHNTVYLNDQNNGSNASAYGFYKTTGADVDFRNNIVWVSRSGSGTNYALYFSSATGAVTTNYNDLVVGGTNPVTGYYAGTAYATLASWRTANSNAFDQNSQQADPYFINPAIGNLQPTNAALNGAATVVPITVATDVAGATRSLTAPDIGAYEFSPALNDAAPQSLSAPVAPVLAGARTVAVTLRNNGSAALTSVQLQYVLNGGTPVVQVFALSPGLAAGATRTLTFTVPATLLAGTNTLAISSSLPNGSPDGYPANDALSVTVTTALAGVYTINKNQPTGGTNFASFTAAGQALTAGGVSASVRFNVLNGPYAEQFALGVIPGVSATDTVVVDGGTSKQAIGYNGTAVQPGTVLLNGSDYVTIQNLTIDASATNSGVGVLLVGQAIYNRVSNCTITAPSFTTSPSANAGIAASGSTSLTGIAGTATGLRLENNVISGGYYGISITGASAALTGGMRLTGNEVRDFYVYGIALSYTAGAQVINNNVHRPTRATLSSFYGLYLVGNVGMAAERNRIHDTFTQNTANTSITYAIYCAANDGLAGQENDFVNNLVYNLNGAGTEYLMYNSSSDYNRMYHNTFVSDNQNYNGSNQTYGFYQTGAAVGIDIRNNIFSLTRSGTGNRIALGFLTTTSTITSNYNDLYLSTGGNFYTGTYGSTNYSALTAWRAVNGNSYDQASVAANPQFAAGGWVPSAVALNAAGQPLARVPRDFNNVLRSTPPDLGAYEFAPATDDVALLSIDAPTQTSGIGANPVTVTIRNVGPTVLSSVTLSYALNGGTPVTQAFTLAPPLATTATQQLTFTTNVVVPAGYNILTVTASLPNGQPDADPSNNSQTVSITLTAPPANDEPCGSIALNTNPLTSANAGATTSTQTGIGLPACSPATAPKDVWFTLTPSGTSTTLTLAGGSAGLVRVFSSPSCSAGPFTQVFCASSGAANTAFTAPITVTGLTAGTRYYVAVSGYGNADVTGSFTISATALLATHTNAAVTAALLVYPNPSASGQLTLRLTTLTGAGSAELLNALGQVVRRQPLAGPAEHSFPTHGLAAGLYTLRVQAGSEVLTRRVVLE